MYIFWKYTCKPWHRITYVCACCIVLYVWYLYFEHIYRTLLKIGVAGVSSPTTASVVRSILTLRSGRELENPLALDRLVSLRRLSAECPGDLGTWKKASDHIFPWAEYRWIAHEWFMKHNVFTACVWCWTPCQKQLVYTCYMFYLFILNLKPQQHLKCTGANKKEIVLTLQHIWPNMYILLYNCVFCDM